VCVCVEEPSPAALCTPVPTEPYTGTIEVLLKAVLRDSVVARRAVCGELIRAARDEVGAPRSYATSAIIINMRRS